MPETALSPRSHSIRMLLYGFGSALLLIVICVVGYLVLSGGGGCDVFFDFRDAHGLKKGSIVTLGGAEAGRVQSVGLGKNNEGVEIAVRLDRQIATHIPSDSRGQVVGGGISGFFSGKALEILTPAESTEPPVHPGSHLKGLENDMEKGAWQIGEAIQQTTSAIGEQMQQIGAAVSDLGDQVQKAIDSPDARKLQEDLNGFIGELQAGGDKAAKKIEEAQKNWPELRARMQAESERLKSSGQGQLAEKMQQAEKQLNDTVRQARTKMDERAAPSATPDVVPTETP